MLATDAVTEEIDGRLAVVAPAVQRILFLNETAAFVWRRLGEGPPTSGHSAPRSPPPTAGSSYDVEVEVSRVLRKLRDAGVISATSSRT